MVFHTPIKGYIFYNDQIKYSDDISEARGHKNMISPPRTYNFLEQVVFLQNKLCIKKENEDFEELMEYWWYVRNTI
jgi:hypothetical protein